MQRALLAAAAVATAALIAAPATSASSESEARQTVATVLHAMEQPPDLGPVPMKGIVACASFSFTERTYRVMGWMALKPVWTNGRPVRRAGKVVMRWQVDPVSCMYRMNGVVIEGSRIERVDRRRDRVVVTVLVRKPATEIVFELERVTGCLAVNCMRVAVMHVGPSRLAA